VNNTVPTIFFAHDLVVDGANVVGSRPDGWWRDRAGAAARLATEIVAALERGTLAAERVYLVLEGAAKAADIPSHPRLQVIRAPADGDSAIVELVAVLPGSVTVVTADRGLRARLPNTHVVGPVELLRGLN
jgi:hypothetical protein